ncbi:alpha/beta hydrolase [Tichowtungia aerotolerans]|uniref:Alpha/beta hydrolase fold domain-containing protein n=1 Tax=Tichowtungia aerotolerans TaxID=2697043 RepID=A0A6P1ME37_9BACT|nr:alpha/beta hydrolase [Tichowtungia aerotolerans]QHI70328.1 alpha/beta hydrolase fold domain-containing protein [Tichowtungia aerotolerans]
MKKMICIVAALAALNSPGAEKLPQPDQTVVYKTTPQGELKLHFFFPPEYNKDKKTPSIVFFHGGGWQTGGPSQFYRQSRHFADRGMIAVSAEYRLGKKHQTTPVECVQDGKSAVRWLRAHSEEWGIDPDHLAAGGGSAGGHVAAATAMLTEFDDPSVSCRPDALVLFNPVINNGPGGYGHGRVSNVWKDFSPLHNIRKNSPPAIFMLGTKDKLIPVSTGKKFKQLMEESGSSCELILYEGQEHSFFNKAKFEETLQAADRFLTSLGYLPKPPQP